MPRPRRAIVPFDAEAVGTRTEAMDAAASAPATSVAPVKHEAAPMQPERTPERQRLADAIERVMQSEAEVAEAGTVIGPAQEATWAAQRALDDAEAVRSADQRDCSGRGKLM